MELIQSDNSFYVNGGHQNTTTSIQPCEVVVSDHQDIIKNSEDYHIHLVRWEIDTFSNLFYLKGDPALQFSVEVLRADPTGPGGAFGEWISKESFLGTFEENEPSLSSFLSSWNRQHSITAAMKLNLNIDGGGRFILQPELTALALPNCQYGVQLQLSDSLADLLSMSKLSSFIEFQVSPKRMIMQFLDFLEAVIREDDPDIIFAPGPIFQHRSRFVDTLKTVARNMLRADQPTYVATGSNTNTSIQHTPHLQGAPPKYHIVNNRWATMYWENIEDTANLPRRVPWSRRVYVHTMINNVYMTNANPGYASPWRQGNLASAPNNLGTIIYPTEFIDTDMVWGVYKSSQSIEDITVAAPNVIVLTGVGHNIVVDMLEIRLDETKFADLYEVIPHAAGWGWYGMALAFPIIGVVEGGGTTTVTLMYPLLSSTVTDMRARLGFNLVCHITEKRPPFIPLINRYDVPDGQFDAALGTLTLIGNHRVEAGDTLYLESRVFPYPVQGPYTITVADMNQEGEVDVEFDGINVTYTEATHRVVLGSHRRVEWYLEDIRRIRLAMLPSILVKTVNPAWHAYAMNNTDIIAMRSGIFRVLKDNSLLYNHALFPVPTQKARLPASEDLHPLLQPSNVRMLSLPPIQVTSATNVADNHTIMFERRGAIDGGQVGGRRQDHGFFEVAIPAATLELFQEYEREVLSVFFGILPDPGYPGGQCVICGVNNERLVLYRPDGAFSLIPLRNGSHYNAFDFHITGGHSELLLRTLKNGNRSLDVKHPLHASGNPLNMGLGDFIVSDIQGAIDQAQYFQFLNITSRDIGVVPERDSAHSSLLPIVSSFQLPSNVESISCNKSGEVTGFSENYYGTVRFVEKGQRRFHKLQSIPGSLRQFSLTAEAVPRDRTKPPLALTLHPGDAFTFQMLFVHGW